MPKIYIKPAHPDLKVRDPETLRLLPPEGMEVEQTSYWLRCASRGDVVICPNPMSINPQPSAVPAKAGKGK